MGRLVHAAVSELLEIDTYLLMETIHRNEAVKDAGVNHVENLEKLTGAGGNGSIEDGSLSPEHPQVSNKLPKVVCQSNIAGQTWSWFRKHIILVQVGINAAMCSFTSGIIIPGFNQLVGDYLCRISY